MRTRIVVEHPENVMQEEAIDINPDFEDALANLESRIFMLTGENVEHAVLIVDGIVGNTPPRVVANTAAARSLCSQQAALSFRLRSTAESQRFRGLGHLSGVLVEPALVTIGDRTHVVLFYIVDNIDVPILIAHSDLARFNVLTYPVDNCLLNQDILALVAPFLFAVLSLSPTSTVKVDTTPEASITDADLLISQREVFDKVTSNVESEVKTDLWDVFLEYQSCWLIPQSGGVAEPYHIKAINVPVKDRLRPLN